MVPRHLSLFLIFIKTFFLQIFLQSSFVLPQAEKVIGTLHKKQD